MKKLVCLLCICLLLVGGISLALADTSSTFLPSLNSPSDSGSGATPDGGGDDGGIGGGGGWPK